MFLKLLTISTITTATITTSITTTTTTNNHYYYYYHYYYYHHYQVIPLTHVVLLVQNLVHLDGFHRYIDIHIYM